MRFTLRVALGGLLATIATLPVAAQDELIGFDQVYQLVAGNQPRAAVSMMREVSVNFRKELGRCRMAAAGGFPDRQPRSLLVPCRGAQDPGVTMTHPNIDMVPVDRWDVERATWVIAGTVLLVSTALAILVDPRLIVFVTATGVASIVVSFTGFCIVGNVLHRLGMPSRLGDPARDPTYDFARTDSWYLERRIYLTVGINLTVASILSLVHSPWWLAFTAFVGTAMFWFAATGFCSMADILFWIGAEPRLAPG